MAGAPRAAAKAMRRIGSEPQTFNIGGNSVLKLLRASMPMLFRVGTGALVFGYSPGVADDGPDAPTYPTYGRVFGKRIAESSQVASFPRPEQPIVLYEFETCPFCRKVREAVAILDLDVLYRPCPKDGTRYRPEAIQKGGKQMFPYMEDPNTGKAMYESDDIIAYLFESYGPGADQIPFVLKNGALAAVTNGLGLLPAGSAGGRARPSKAPEMPLELWSYEASPFCKIVREQLSEMEIPHVVHSCARGSPGRQALMDRAGVFQVPYLEDPNAPGGGVSMFESNDIIAYLNETYGA